MHDSITMADVGSIVNVSGSRIATPFGPPKPGSTPTNMPSTRPTIINASVFQVIRTAKPWSRRPNASICAFLVAQPRFERPLRHDDVESDVEGYEHESGEQKTSQERLPECNAADQPHEAGRQ